MNDIIKTTRQLSLGDGLKVVDSQNVGGGGNDAPQEYKIDVNLDTSLSSSSTDSQAPSAKATYELVSAQVSTEKERAESNYVKYTEQSLTDTQKTQARNNIGANDFLNVLDTRNTNEPPSYYRALGMRTMTEFKTGSVVGLSSEDFVTLNTITPWNDTSGGAVKQVAFGHENTNIYIRYSTDEDTWSDWITNIDSRGGTINGQVRLNGGNIDLIRNNNLFSMFCYDTDDYKMAGLYVLNSEKEISKNIVQFSFDTNLATFYGNLGDKFSGGGEAYMTSTLTYTGYSFTIPANRGCLIHARNAWTYATPVRIVLANDASTCGIDNVYARSADSYQNERIDTAFKDRLTWYFEPSDTERIIYIWAQCRASETGKNLISYNGVLL